MVSIPEGGDAVMFSSLCQNLAISLYVGTPVPFGRAKMVCGRRERKLKNKPAECIGNHIIGMRALNWPYAQISRQLQTFILL